jgi:hypothetical protein
MAKLSGMVDPTGELGVIVDRWDRECVGWGRQGHRS